MITFTIKRRNHTVRVRLLPTVKDVHRALTPRGRARDGKITHGFFQGNATNGNGLIVLPVNAPPGLVAHESVHAGKHWQAHWGGRTDAEEELATIVEHLTDRICTRIHRARYFPEFEGGR